MTKKLLSFFAILTFCMTVSASSYAQEARSGSDLRDIDPGLAKQIARDKQLLEIWKDHVRTLTRERDEAYQHIEELKSSQAAPVQGTTALETAFQEREAALREAEALRSQVTTLKSAARDACSEPGLSKILRGPDEELYASAGIDQEAQGGTCAAGIRKDRCV